MKLRSTVKKNSTYLGYIEREGGIVTNKFYINNEEDIIRKLFADEFLIEEANEDASDLFAYTLFYPTDIEFKITNSKDSYENDILPFSYSIKVTCTALDDNNKPIKAVLLCNDISEENCLSSAKQIITNLAARFIKA